MQLIIGNKAYSSWSLRGWLAVRQSGLACEEIVLPLGSDAFAAACKTTLAPSAGKVPVLWDGEAVVWDSLAILDHLADRVGRDRFWPKADDARAMARSLVAEMHSSFTALRGQCPMNVRRRVDVDLDEAARGDVIRILGLWAEARARFGRGGPFLFGSFGAADIFYAPIVSRFITYQVPLPGFAEAYAGAVWEHEWLRAWVAAAQAEEWVIPRFEKGRAA